MENLDNYFKDFDKFFFEIGTTFAKRLYDDNGDEVDKLTEDTVRVWSTSEKLDRQFCPNFDGFICIPEDIINVINLKKLEGKLVIIEWGEEGLSRFISGCSAVNCVRIMKSTDNFFYPKDWNLKNSIIGVQYKKDWPNNIISDMESSLITIDKLKNYQHFSDGENHWKFKWKIWIPFSCYNELYRNKRIFYDEKLNESRKKVKLD